MSSFILVRDVIFATRQRRRFSVPDAAIYLFWRRSISTRMRRCCANTGTTSQSSPSTARKPSSTASHPASSGKRSLATKRHIGHKIDFLPDGRSFCVPFVPLWLKMSLSLKFLNGFKQTCAFGFAGGLTVRHHEVFEGGEFAVQAGVFDGRC